MKEVFLQNVLFDSMRILFLLSFPVLFSVLFIGVIISIFQAATQINEQTLSFVPKLIVVFLVLFFFGNWMINIFSDYVYNLFKNIIHIISL
jgi:flagellar biosynthetic protein FliQ